MPGRAFRPPGKRVRLFMNARRAAWFPGLCCKSCEGCPSDGAIGGQCEIFLIGLLRRQKDATY